MSNMEYVVSNISKKPSQTANGVSSDMSRKHFQKSCCISGWFWWFRLLLLLESTRLIIYLGTTAGTKHTTNRLQQNHWNVFFSGFAFNQQKNSCLSVDFLGSPRNYLLYQTFLLAACSDSVGRQEHPLNLGDSEVNESNGLDLFLTRVPEDARWTRGWSSMPAFFFLKLKLRHPNNLFEDFEDWKSMERQYFWGSIVLTNILIYIYIITYIIYIYTCTSVFSS